MDLSGDLQMWVTFAIILAAVASYALERISLEVTSIAVIVLLIGFFTLFPVPDGAGGNRLSAEVLLSGLAHPALIAILALLVVGQGLFQTGALDDVTRWIAELGATAPRRTLTTVYLSAALISAFMNNTPVVVMFIPVIGALSVRLSMNPSKTIMPLSYIAILGGMLTLIGSSTNLLVAGLTTKLGYGPIGFFDFIVPGAVLFSIGAIYVLFVMPSLLTPRKSLTDAVADQSGKQYIAQIQVTHDHPLNGATAVAGMFPALKNMTVRMIQRGEHPILPPFEDVTLKVGDQVIVAATRAALTDALKSKASILSADPEWDGSESSERGERRASQLMLAEAVIAPGSRMIGRTVEQSGVHAATGCIVLGIQRRSRMIRMRMSEIRLEAGDVILVVGSGPEMRTLRSSRDALLMEWSATELPRLGFANRALAIFIATVLAAASGVVPIVVAALAGALAMVPAGCLNIRQASRAFDRRIYLLIGAAIALASSLEATGGAAFIAHGVVGTLAGASPAVVLSALFLVIALLTNMLSNNATAVLFTPIAINTAIELGVEPMVFVFAVIFAANCSFATPMGYQTNLLVMGPGHYRFSDFLKAGSPLIFILWVAYSLFAPWYYGL